MTAPLILGLFALGAAAAGSRHLAQSRWVMRSPSWGIWAWQALTLAVASSIVLIGVTLALPILPVGPQLSAAVQSTHLDITDHYATPAGNGLALTALAGTLAVVARVIVLVARNLHASAVQRRTQLEGLALVGSPHPAGFTVIEHAAPLVYSLPGRRRAVVVTRGALETLTSRELDSVLAHERLHLRARHDLALALSSALAITFRLPLFTTAHTQVAILAEMQADDAATDASSRRAMASALLSLGTTPGPNGAAPATVSSAYARIQRLTGTPSVVNNRQRAAVGACTLALLAAPVLLALAPALEASTRDCCHLALAPVRR